MDRTAVTAACGVPAGGHDHLLFVGGEHRHPAHSGLPTSVIENRYGRSSSRQTGDQMAPCRSMAAFRRNEHD
jgi:hypothetical protein